MSKRDISDIAFEDVIGTLAIVKLVYDETGIRMNTQLNEYSLCETYFEALDYAGDREESADDYYGGYIDKYSFKFMPRYYELCKEYGRMNKVKFSKNPFVLEAARLVNSEMNGVDSYCISWSLFTPKRIEKKKYPCLAIFLDPEFFQPVQLVEALCNIRAFYREGVIKLEKAIKAQKNNIIVMPDRTAERKIAA